MRTAGSRWGGFLGTVLATIAVGCGDEQPDRSSTSVRGGETMLDLRVGDLIPLTGRLSDFGRPGEKAADLALETIVTAVDKVGADHHVAVRHEDERSEPDGAVRAARTLTDGGATCLTGAWTGSGTISVAESVTIGEGVLLISPAATSDEITRLEDSGLVNRTAAPDSLQGPALVEAIRRELGDIQGRTVNVAARDDAYGNGLRETFATAWEATGGTVGQTVAYAPDLASYEAEAARLTEGDPDAYAIFDFPPTFERVGQALSRTGDFDPRKAFTADGLAIAGLPERIGDEATDGLTGTAPASPRRSGPAEAFDELYTASSGPPRQTFDAQNFDAVILCYLAAVAAGSTEGADMAAQLRGVTGPGGKDYTWEQLPKAIEALQNGEDIDYEGASGPVNLDPSGDVSAGVYDLFRFKDRQIEVFDQLPIAHRMDE